MVTCAQIDRARCADDVGGVGNPGWEWGDPPGQASAQESNGLSPGDQECEHPEQTDKNSVVLTTAPKYAIVAAVGPTKGCGAHSCAWVKVAYDGVEGWSKGALLRTRPPRRRDRGRQRRSQLPGRPRLTHGQVIAVIPAGGELTLTGRQSYPWVSVSYNGKKGWVFSEFLTVFPPPQY